MSEFEIRHPQSQAMLVAGGTLIDLARQAATEMSDSYRVKVGAATLALNPATGEHAIFVAGNRKPAKGEQIVKYCAEASTWAQASRTPFRYIEGMAVASNAGREVSESVTGLASLTLHTCTVCLGKVDFYQQEGSLTIPDETPIITSTVGTNVHQIHSIAEFRRLYVEKTADSEEIGRAKDEYLAVTPDIFNKAGNLIPRTNLPSDLSPAHFMRCMIQTAILAA